MKILLLGGTGSMGRPLADILTVSGHDVLVTTRTQRVSCNDKLKYMVGNVHDLAFLQEVLSDRFDAIVDFMHYTSIEFAERYNLFLKSTEQYIFLSSARVYADSRGEAISESSKRLIDNCYELELINSDEYPIAKARCENYLRDSGVTNWTIIRPYITFGYNRLQLGIYELEDWFYRALNRRTILVPNEILNAKTTLTYGGDVAEYISLLIGNANANGKAINITSDISLTWKEIVNMYSDIFEEKVGFGINICSDCDINEYMRAFYSSRWQIKYDRCYDRIFDNSLIKRITNQEKKADELYADIREVLLDCLNNLASVKPGNSPVSTAYQDKFTGDKTRICEFSSRVSKIRYAIGRYFPIPIDWYININNRISNLKHKR